MAQRRFIQTGLLLLLCSGCRSADPVSEVPFVKPSSAPARAAYPMRDQFYGNENARPFFNKVQSVQGANSLAEAEAKMGMKGKWVPDKEKYPYSRGTETNQNPPTQVYPQPQYRWDDPNSHSHVIIEFPSEQQPITLVLEAVYS